MFYAPLVIICCLLLSVFSNGLYVLFEKDFFSKAAMVLAVIALCVIVWGALYEWF